jgi:hypothetical protein
MKERGLVGGNLAAFEPGGRAVSLVPEDGWPGNEQWVFTGTIDTDGVWSLFLPVHEVGGRAGALRAGDRACTSQAAPPEYKRLRQEDQEAAKRELVTGRAVKRPHATEAKEEGGARREAKKQKDAPARAFATSGQTGTRAGTRTA